ncbi:Hypothetical protein MPV1_54 [Marinitoga phage MPV1]
MIKLMTFLTLISGSILGILISGIAKDITFNGMNVNNLLFYILGFLFLLEFIILFSKAMRMEIIKKDINKKNKLIKALKKRS